VSVNSDAASVMTRKAARRIAVLQRQPLHGREAYRHRTQSEADKASRPYCAFVPLQQRVHQQRSDQRGQNDLGHHRCGNHADRVADRCELQAQHRDREKHAQREGTDQVSANEIDAQAHQIGHVGHQHGRKQRGEERGNRHSKRGANDRPCGEPQPDAERHPQQHRDPAIGVERFLRPLRLSRFLCHGPLAV